MGGGYWRVPAKRIALPELISISSPVGYVCSSITRASPRWISATPTFESTYTARCEGHDSTANAVAWRTVCACEFWIRRKVDEGSSPGDTLTIVRVQFVPARLMLTAIRAGGPPSVMSPETMKYRTAAKTIGTVITTMITTTMMRMIFPESERCGG